MNYHTELNKYIRILNEKSTGLHRQENIAEKLQCFNRIREFGKGSAINPLMPFLRSDNSIIREKAAETILLLFGNLKSITDSIACLKYLSISKEDLDFYRVDFNEQIYLQLLRLASVNNDGFIRQRAVEEIARLKDVNALWFILYRLGDWVTDVRQTAFQTLHSFLKPEYVEGFLNKLLHIDWLLIAGRVNLKQTHDEIMHFIFSRAFSPDFLKKIHDFNDRERVLFYKYLSIYQPAKYKAQINNLVTDKSFLVRLDLIRHLSSYQESTQKQLIGDFLRDPSPSIRLNALFATKRFAPAYDDIIFIMLSDKSGLVRDISRRLLKSKGLDYPRIYRERIANGESLFPNLFGLAEVAVKEDLPLFERYIVNANSRIVAACLVSIKKFDKEKALTWALQLLSLPANRVQRIVIEILLDRFDDIVETVRILYITGTFETKKVILKLYSRVPRWELVPDLLLAVLDENKELQQVGWHCVVQWTRVGIIFKKMSPSDRERINELLKQLDKGQIESTRERERAINYLQTNCR